MKAPKIARFANLALDIAGLAFLVSGALVEDRP